MTPTFRIAGFRVTVDPLLPVVVVVIGWVLANHYLPGGSYLTGGVASLFLTLSILFHELGHALVARRLNLSIERIHLFLFGGMAELRTRPVTAWQEAAVAMSGPIASLILGLAAIGMSRVVPDPYSLTYRLLVFVGQMNLLLAIFNLFPIFPLDGGRTVRALFWGLTGRYLLASRWVRNLSIVFVGILAAFAMHTSWLDGGRGWALYAMMTVYMGYMVYSGSRELTHEPSLDDLLTDARTGVAPMAHRTMLQPVMDKDLMLLGIRSDGHPVDTEPEPGNHIDLERPETYAQDLRYQADVVPVCRNGLYLGMADAGELRFWLLEWRRP